MTTPTRFKFPAATDLEHLLSRVAQLAVNVAQLASDEDTEEVHLAVLYAIEQVGLGDGDEEDALEATALAYLADPDRGTPSALSDRSTFTGER